MHPANHKTIFVLDHSAYFGMSCDSTIEFDFTKSRGPGFIPLAPIAKSLWTCSVEAAVEYCRIVWDLFPNGKLIRFIISDTKAHCLNSWSAIQQSLNHLLNGLAGVGVPSEEEGGGIVPGLKAAVHAMCEASEQQHDRRTSLNENTPQVVNRNRVICITNLADSQALKNLEETFLQELIEANKVAISSDLLIAVDECELVVMSMNTGVWCPKHQVSGELWVEAYSVGGSCGLSTKLSSLILSHYRLSSTTVTGIPMKEEQNASSSANYDVEILHDRDAHLTLFRGCGVEMEQIRTDKEGMEYQTITLKWCTPRGITASEMQHCTEMHRITPVDVNSRPSSCLINFLLGGRSVMLEVVRRGGGKALSHMLCSHAAQIYMHSLAIGRSLHDDSPSISEGPGGRVTDYRITDFGALMQANKLVAGKGRLQGSLVKRTRSRLDRHTKFWPMTISSTVIFNCKTNLEPLLTHMLQAELREAEVTACKQCIYSLVGCGGKGRGGRDAQLWSELEAFLRAHCVSEKHINILNTLLEARDASSHSLPHLDQMARSGERASVIRATTDSPMSPDAAGRKSVLELWLRRLAKTKQRPEFAGLATAEVLSSGRLRARLYPHLKEKKRPTRIME